MTRKSSADSNKEAKRRELIREYAGKGYSANRIQRELSKQGLGMQRKRLLAEVRRAKGLSRKPEPQKYVPIKYRRSAGFGAYRGKWLAVYGSVDGKSRRIEMVGFGRQLYDAMQVVSRYPPKRRFVKCSAEDAPYLLDYSQVWDERPEAES
ncbi:MAG: hypothetical protein QXL10_01790 [Candidatus Bathyarchaeia archaeon]